MLQYHFIKKITKVQPNQIWQDQDDAHILIILARSIVLPYLIGSYFKCKNNWYKLAINKPGTTPGET